VVKHNNDNVNVYFNKHIDTDINIDKYESSKKVELIADRLVDKLCAPKSRAYFCKVAYKLSESRIWQNYEAAINGKNPVGLFIWLCERDLQGGY